MKYIYVDASVLVSIAVTDPRRAKEAQRHIESFDIAVTSALSLVETQAGLSQQLHAVPRELMTAEQNLNRLIERSQLVRVTDEVLREARTLVRRYRVGIGLRSADAVHLASANILRSALTTRNDSDPESNSEVECVTADAKQFAAFTAEGYVGRLLP